MSCNNCTECECGADLVARLEYHVLGACTCLTTTNEIEFHSKTCRYRARNENRTARTYWKCEKLRGPWTGGTGTDIRAGAAACKLWEGIEK